MRTRKWFIVTTIIMMLVTAIPSGAGAWTERWQWRNPSPQGNDLLGIAYGNGQFVAVGAGGAIMTSPDGAAWTVRPQAGRERLRAVAHGGGQFVAVGNGPTVLTSADGRQWERQGAPGTQPLISVAYGGGQFVAITETGMLSSADGKSWTVRATAFTLWDVTYGNGRFVAVGEGEIYTSPDGIAWTKSAQMNPGARAVAYGAGLFVATTSAPGPEPNTLYTILTSEDGQTWTRRRPAGMDDWGPLDWTVSRGYWDIAYDAGTFVAVGTNGKVITSPDGLTWSDGAGSTTPQLHGVAYGNGTFVAVGLYGAVFTAPGGQRWTERSGGVREHLNGVTYGDGRYVAVGEKGTILTSVDAERWEPAASGVTAALRAVTYARGLYVAVGDGGTILRSADGLTWTQSAAPEPRLLRAVTFGARQFVAVGDRAIFLSPDGVNWHKAAEAPEEVLYGVAYGSNRFVAGGTTLLWSADGESWTRAAGAQGSLVGVAYGLGQFVAMRGEGNAGLSEDGNEWYWGARVDPHPYAKTMMVRAVGYGQNWFMALGTYVTGPQHEYQPYIFPSRWAQLWGHEPLPQQGFQLLGLTYGAGRYVLVGEYGRILTAPAETEYPACREIFADLYSHHPACGAIRRLVEQGAIGGYADGTFRPDAPVTRAEFVKMLTVALNRTLEPDGPLPFSDTAGHWGARGGYLQAAAKMNQAGGYQEPVIAGFPDGTFRPDARILRAQLAKMLAVASRRETGALVWSPYLDVERTDWFAPYVSMAYRDRITGPDAASPLWPGLMLGPDDEVSRAEAAVMIDNLLQAVPEAAR